MARGLVVIDIQKDYFPGGRMELVGADAAADRAQELLGAFRASGEPVFHVQHVWDAPDAPFFAPGSEGVEIHPSVSPADERAADRQGARERVLGDLAGGRPARRRGR